MDGCWDLIKDVLEFVVMALLVIAFALGGSLLIYNTYPHQNSSLAMAQFQAQAPLTLVRLVSYDDGVYQLKVGNHDATGLCRALGKSPADQSTQCLPFQVWPDRPNPEAR